jgi:hypothetical protein
MLLRRNIGTKQSCGKHRLKTREAFVVASGDHGAFVVASGDHGFGIDHGAFAVASSDHGFGIGKISCQPSHTTKIKIIKQLFKEKRTIIRNNASLGLLGLCGGGHLRILVRPHTTFIR